MNLPFGNGVDLTLGLFDTTVGYETEASASNPNVMRSYGYLIGTANPYRVVGCN